MENSKDRVPSGTFKMVGNWKDQARILKIKYIHLTDDDLEYEVGKEDELLNRIQRRLNRNREEVIGIIKKVQPILGL